MRGRDEREGGRERWRQSEIDGGREREGRERKIEREIIFLFKLLRDDYLKLNCFYYCFKYF